jgi:hypothetical protein
MAYSNIVTGSEVAPAFFNAVKQPIMDGQELDGHGPKIIDDWLSDDPTAIKAQFGILRNSFAVVAATGRNINVTGGAATLEDNTIVSVADTSLSLPADAISFVWVSQAGVVEFGARLPVRCLPLARVTTLANSIAVNGIVDLRPRFRVGPVPRSLAAFGGAATNDVVISTNTVVTSAIRCRNFTLNAGVTLSAPSGLIEIFASGDVNINGIVTVSPPIAGASGFLGVNGNTHYVIETGRGPGAGGGTNSPAAPTYSWELSPFGSSGASGFAIVVSGNGTLTQSRGGNGGGSIKIFAAGAISISGQLSARGGNAVAGNSTAGLVLQLSGAGGGAGGSIVLASLTSVTASAASQLDVRGGDGASAFTLGAVNPTAGGSGGGGGWIVSRSPLNNFTGATTLLNGGAFGATVPSGVAAVAGGGGGTFAGQGGPSSNVVTAGAIGQTFFDNIPPI